jgi:1-acyl-sn-glycerol-3-phosphate acyltransferase
MWRALRWVLLFLFRQVVRLYFRKVEVVGAPDATVERRLFGANHVNGIIDPMLVMTATWCRIAPLAKAPLWKVPGLYPLLRAAEAVPVVRRQDEPGKAEGSNDALFEAVARHLRTGANVLIFPEGISHNEPHVVRLKTGAGRMLVGARERGVEGLTFQAVGLEFDEREVFRSRALVIFGPVRSVDALAAQGGDLVESITETLRQDLTGLVVEGATWEERALISRVAELLAQDAGDRSLQGWNSIGLRVKEARRALEERQGELVDEVGRAVRRYDEGLAAAGLSEAQLLAGEGDPGARALRRLVLIALLPLALLGAALYWAPYQVPKLAPRLARGEVDVVSTYKLGLGLLAFPTWALLLALLALVALPAPWGAPGAALAVALPFAVLPWLDELDRLRSAQDRGEEVDAEPPGEDELRRRRSAALAAIARARAVIGA